MRIGLQSKSLNSHSKARVLYGFCRDTMKRSCFEKDNFQSTSFKLSTNERVLEAVDEALVEGIDEPEKLILLKEALTKKMSFSGTKVQVKPSFKDGTLDKLQLILK